jgi:O-acetyl-ADP-ribose deacetylase (regulator of RNase III)
MPVIFISLDDEFTRLMRASGFEAYTGRVEEFDAPPGRPTYYISPANSLGFMDGGIDLALSRHVFPGVEPEVKRRIRELGRETALGRPYLPIGSATLIDREPRRGLVVAPTMWLPQDVSATRNAYHALRAALYLIAAREGGGVMDDHTLDGVSVICTFMCGGYGKMSREVSARQMMAAIRDFREFVPKQIFAFPDKNTIHTVMAEPNAAEQPDVYMNTEFRGR